MDLTPGQTVVLTVQWGTQTRLRCPRCHHYAPNSDGTVTCACGATFQLLATGEHQVVMA